MGISEEAYQLMMRQRERNARTDAQIESDLLRQIMKVADAAGRLSYHTVNSRKSRPGFPDITTIHRDGGRLIIAETKMEWGVLSTEQKHWKHALERCTGVDYYLWYPEDWDTIAERLAKR